MAAATPLTTYVIGEDYQDTNYGGAQLQETGTAACSASVGYGLNLMPVGWSNDISSARSNMSNCNHFTHWDGTYQSGANITCSNNSCYYIGDAMNDRTSSETISK